MVNRTRGHSGKRIDFRKVVIVVALLVLIVLFFVLNVSLTGFSVISVSGFSASNGTCTNCSINGTIELVNIHPNADDSGLISYWQFTSDTTDSVGGYNLVASGSPRKVHERYNFDGSDDSMAKDCVFGCTGSPDNDCHQWDTSKTDCGAYTNRASQCSWTSQCTGTLSCGPLSTQGLCEGVTGCSWEGSYCYDNPGAQIDCSYWDMDYTTCNTYSGYCSWSGPCGGTISCSQFTDSSSCNAITNCAWGVSGSPAFCEPTGGGPSCNQWYSDRSGCEAHSAGLGYGSCSWDGPCDGSLTCSPFSSTGGYAQAACTSVSGCSLDVNFPIYGTASWSAFTWVRTESSADKDILWAGTSSANGALNLILTGGKVRADLYGSAGPTSITSVNDGKWHLVGAVYDGTNMNVYVDGNNEGAQAKSANILCDSFAVGMSKGHGWFGGDIDEVRLYDRALSALEVADLYSSGLFVPTGTFNSTAYSLGGTKVISTLGIGANQTESNVNVSSQVRTSSDGINWNTWSSENTGGSVSVDNGQYTSYKLILRSNGTNSPEVINFSLTYSDVAGGLDFVSGSTDSDGSTLTRDNIKVNLSYTASTTLSNITVRLYNSDGLTNSSSSTSSNYYINFVGLANGLYRFNATAYGSSGVINHTGTRTVSVNAGSSSSSSSSGGSSGGGSSGGGSSGGATGVAKNVSSSNEGIEVVSVPEEVKKVTKKEKYEPAPEKENPVRRSIRIVIENTVELFD